MAQNEPELATDPAGPSVAKATGMDALGRIEMDSRAAGAASHEPHTPMLDNDEASARVMLALEENARLARATMAAIDRYVEVMIRFLTSGPGGPLEARRRAAALGLHRLEAYLSRMRLEAREPMTSYCAQSKATGENP
jgi:hypothetical protein